MAPKSQQLQSFLVMNSRQVGAHNLHATMIQGKASTSGQTVLEQKR